MQTTLYYWPEIQGRGEFVRLALEQAGVPYADIGREDEAAIERFLDDAGIATPPFAPPFLVAGKLVIPQTANILLYLGQHYGLAPQDEAGGLWTHGLQLTIADFVVEIHDTHHPIASGDYYEDQQDESGGTARAGGRAAAHRGVPGVTSAHSVQHDGHLPALPGAGCADMIRPARGRGPSGHIGCACRP
ncbi:glutathione S-transferase [Ralstonia solanacearum]|nr:glutathione S-transferase [Ralstonia solanacearum]